MKRPALSCSVIMMMRSAFIWVEYSIVIVAILSPLNIFTVYAGYLIPIYIGAVVSQATALYTGLGLGATPQLRYIL